MREGEGGMPRWHETFSPAAMRYEITETTKRALMTERAIKRRMKVRLKVRDVVFGGNVLRENARVYHAPLCLH